MVAEKEEEDEEKAEEVAATGPPTSVRTRTTKDKLKSSSSSIIIDPTPLDEKEQSQLKEAIKKAMLDEKGQDKGYFTIGEVTSVLSKLPNTNWTESKIDRVISEWYDKGRITERQGIGKYTPV
jgi:UDP-N-acetyl-D-mannosaminuronate dehydrogenase